MARFKKCDKPDCKRLVHEGTAYCCGPCSFADSKKFEIGEPGTFFAHSPGCDERAIARKNKKVGDYD
jgi:hypothetical protein